MKKIHIDTNVVIYKTKSGGIEFLADVKKETLWATQAQMAAVFGVNPQAITKHLKNIYKESELTRLATCSKMEQVQMEGSRRVNRIVETYNLDAIISAGYQYQGLLEIYFSHLMVMTYIQRLKKRLHISFILWLKTIRLQMAINAWCVCVCMVFEKSRYFEYSSIYT